MQPSRTSKLSGLVLILIAMAAFSGQAFATYARRRRVYAA